MALLIIVGDAGCLSSIEYNKVYVLDIEKADNGTSVYVLYVPDKYYKNLLVIVLGVVSIGAMLIRAD